ncbi:hypothetical protein F4803DRAFT_40619 [Xylaria telfairii]|nr:hypothetical protein F4803DRAFT_40619 [Xylaria telfairii]
MPLHPRIAQGLDARKAKAIILNNRSQESLANPFLARVQHPTNRLGGHRSLVTNLTEDIQTTPLRQTQNVGGVPRHQIRDPITPSSSLLGIQPVYQPSPAQPGYPGSANSSLPHSGLSQRIGNHTPSSGQGPMSIGNEMGSPHEMVLDSSATPRIVIGSHDQQQVLVPGPWLQQSGRRQLSPSTLEPLNQYPYGISQQRTDIRHQLSSIELQLLLLPRCDSLAIAREDSAIPNSWVYRDSLTKLLKQSDWERFIHPRPPGHPTFTGAGPDAEGGVYIQLRLENKRGQVVEFPLSVLYREQVRTEIPGVDIVLCQDYFRELATGQTPPMGIEAQMGGMMYSNLAYHFQLPGGQFQNAISSAENLAYGYASPGFPFSNRMEGIQTDRSHLTTPAFQYTVSSTSQGSSAALVSSTTSPDMPLSIGEASPFNQETYSNMSWQHHNK